MKLKNCFFIVCLSTSFFVYPFSYDSAIYAAQKGDIKSADEQLRTIVVNSPDSADILYDAGVLASQLNNPHQAAAYFSRAVQCAQDDKKLCFRAHFNAGNVSVANKDLKVALAHYDKALAIDPDNEYACHNRDRVAQMLQEQEKQQDQQKNNEQKNDQEQKDNQDQQKSEQQDKQEQSGDDQQRNDGNDQQQANEQQQQKQNNNLSENGSDQKSQGNQGNDSEQGDKREEGKQEGNKEKNNQNSTNDKKRDGEQKFDEKSEGAKNKGEDQQGKQHGKTPEQQDQTHNKNSIPSQDKREQGKDVSPAKAAQNDKTDDQGIAGAQEQDESKKLGQKIDDPWLLGILNDQELQDKAVNKRLMEARIRQHGGKNGQNCW